MKDIYVFHGSRGGIRGEIKPLSRQKCDFGQGFYMGTNPKQVKGLIVEEDAPVFYRLRLRLSEIPEEKILYLRGEDWMYTVLACRQKVPEINNLDFVKEKLEALEKCDVAIGPIADDRMNEAIRQFESFSMTDKALQACLASVDYGEQIVAKTPSACAKIDILDEKKLSGMEAEDAKTYSYQKRAESGNVVSRMKLKYQREGRFLNEILGITE